MKPIHAFMAIANTLLNDQAPTQKEKIINHIKTLLKDEKSTIFKLGQTQHTTEDILPILSVEINNALNTYFKHKKNHLSKAEQYTLFYEWQKTGNTKPLSKLINAFSPMINTMARKIARQSGTGYEDLVSEANLAAFQALQKFDPTKGCAVSTFILRPMQGAMARYVMDMSGVTRIGSNNTDVHIWRHYNRVKNLIEQEINRPLTQDDNVLLAEKLNVPLSSLERMIPRMQRQDKSLSAPISKNPEQESGTYQDILIDQSSNKNQTLVESTDAQKAIHIINDTIKKFPERQQDILRRRFLSEIPTHFHILGKDHNVSKERIRQIEVECLKKIRKNLEKSGLNPKTLF